MSDNALALVVQPDGHAELTVTDTDLDSIKALIGGGWLEGVAGVFGEWTAYGDEEGRLKGMDPNPMASLLVHKAGGASDMLVGPVVFFGLRQSEDPEEGMVETSVPPGLLLVASSVVQL